MARRTALTKSEFAIWEKYLKANERCRVAYDLVLSFQEWGWFVRTKNRWH